MFTPTDKWQWFANLLWYTGDARMGDVPLDSSGLVQQPLGLDYTLLGDNVGDFSSIDIERLRAGLGFNFAFNESFVWNTVGEYGDFNDRDPYLYDTSGKKFTFFTGVMYLW